MLKGSWGSSNDSYLLGPYFWGHIPSCLLTSVPLPTPYLHGDPLLFFWNLGSHVRRCHLFPESSLIKTGNLLMDPTAICLETFSLPHALTSLVCSTYAYSIHLWSPRCQKQRGRTWLTHRSRESPKTRHDS